MSVKSNIFLSTGVTLHVEWTKGEQEEVQKRLADPHKRWLRIGEGKDERWIAIPHIVEVKFTAIPEAD